MRKRCVGFTLVEIMIVVGIIALLAAISIPNLLRSRHNANESAAQAQLKTVSQACESYRTSVTPPEYPLQLADLVNSTPQYLHSGLDTATTGMPKNGYFFDYTRLSPAQYVCSARPEALNITGTRTFAVNETGMLRAADLAGAGVNTAAAYEAMEFVQ